MPDDKFKTSNSGRFLEGMYEGWYDAELAVPPEDEVVLVVFDEGLALGYFHKDDWEAATFPSEGRWESPAALYWRFLPKPFRGHTMGFEHPDDDSGEDESSELAEPSIVSTVVS
jgi:hypothetical protein